MTHITTTDLLDKLQGHQIAVELVGAHRSAVRFCSLRAPENSGVYYATEEVSTLPVLAGSIIICDHVRTDTNLESNSLLITKHPQRVFYLLQRAYHSTQAKIGIHPTAIVSDDAVIDPASYIGPYCIVGQAVISAGCALESHVVVRDHVTLQTGVTIESHSTIGATGVAWVWDEENKEQIVQPQTGGVLISQDTFIGTDVTIVRGSINEITTIGANCLIAHGTKIGHSCTVGNHVHFANNVTVAGSVDIGHEAFLGSGCVIRPRVTLPRATTVGAGAVVIESPTREDMTLIGVPAKTLAKRKGRMSGVPSRTQSLKPTRPE